MAPTPIAQAIGLAGLSAFCAGFVGLLPPAGAAMAIVCGGAVAGFCFWTIKADGDSGDDGGLARDRPPDEHPPSPEPEDGPIDWQQFDRLRAQWERPRVPAR